MIIAKCLKDAYNKHIQEKKARVVRLSEVKAPELHFARERPFGCCEQNKLFISVWIPEFRTNRQREADEVEVFELFGGGLPVMHRTVTARAKGMGDRSHKPYGPMLRSPCGSVESFIHECLQETRKCRGERRSMDIHENRHCYV